MKLIESKAEYIPQESGLEGIYRQIELSGRTAYKSEDKITSDSAKGFVDRMIKSHHGACLEHGTVYLKIPANIWQDCEHEWVYMFPESLPWVSIDCDGKYWYITTNFRHILENNVGTQTMMNYLCEPTKDHEKRYTMKFTTDRGVSHELVRHRVFSFLQESTRYCNYSKDKFGNRLTFIIPSWVDRNREPNTEAEVAWLNAMKIAERAYLDMVNGITRQGIIIMPADEKLTPQQARAVLPNSLKTEIIMTGFASDWRHFFDLRLFGKTGAPHPDMKLLAEKAQKAMQDAGIWDDIMSKESKFK